jgi:hypothetical protein
VVAEALPQAGFIMLPHRFENLKPIFSKNCVFPGLWIIFFWRCQNPEMAIADIRKNKNEKRSNTSLDAFSLIPMCGMVVENSIVMYAITALLGFDGAFHRHACSCCRTFQENF